MSAEAGIRPGLKILGTPDAIACAGDACLIPDAPVLVATEGSQVAKRPVV